MNHRREAENAEPDPMNTAIVNLDAEFAKAPSTTLRNTVYVLAAVAMSATGVFGASALRGTWPKIETLIGGAIGTPFCAWLFAKRSNDGWRVPTVASFIGIFVAASMMIPGILGLGTTPAAIPLVIAGCVVLMASVGCFIFVLLTQ